MAVAAYSIPELTTMNTAEAVTNWAEPGTWAAGGIPAAEADYFIQGTGCISKSYNATGLGGLMYSAGAQAIASPNAYFAWVWFGAPNAIDTLANGGLRLMVGDLNTVFRSWYVLGSDTYNYGGWRCIPVDPNVAGNADVGVPSGVFSFFGMAVNVVNAVAKGNPCAIDVIRHGRGTLQIISGDATAYGTFVGAASSDQNVTNRWGLCQSIDGSFIVQGHLLLGVAATAVDFRDANRAVVIANTTKVTADFNTIEVRNATSRVDWTNVSVTALGTVSKGRFVVTDNADINLLTCSFTDMGNFSFLAATGALSCTFRRCGQITAPGSDLRGSIVDSYTGAVDTSAVVWDAATDTDGLLNTMSFTKGTNAHHAIELGLTSPTTVTLRGISFTGFNVADAANDSVLHVKRTTGTVTINTVGCTGTVSYKSAGATVVIVADPVTVAVNVKITAGTNLQNARVLLKAASGGPFPFDVTVTIVNSTTTATVTHTTHAMATSDKVVIKGASLQANNGVFTITKIDANSYSYTMGSDPGGSPTGTIKSTFVALSGLTDASGNITMSRVFSAAQPVSGWVRYGASPFYKPAALGGSISATTGYSSNALMVDDV